MQFWFCMETGTKTSPIKVTTLTGIRLLLWGIGEKTLSISVLESQNLDKHCWMILWWMRKILKGPQ